MNPVHFLRALCGALLAAVTASPVSAEGTFDIPPGAHFNPQKLERVGDFLRDQIANGKIPGATLLIQSTASRSIMNSWACRMSSPDSR
jgi:hypothetical protein